MFAKTSKHIPLPQPVIDVLLRARRHASKRSALQIEVADILAAIDIQGEEHQERPQRDLPLSEEAKAGLEQALECAGDRGTVKVEHLRAACSQ
jgi:hypothetical protein